jgi:hypothetical protein
MIAAKLLSKLLGFRAVRQRLLNEELTTVKRLLLERDLMNNLQVYDFDETP